MAQYLVLRTLCLSKCVYCVLTTVSAILQALLAPASLIANNAGAEGEVVIEKIKESEWEMGYNAMTDKYENLIESGVLDPAKVTRCALQNAASVAGMVLTTQAIIVEKPKPKFKVEEPAEGALSV